MMPPNNRDALITYNAMLFAVVLLLVGAVPMRADDLALRVQSVLRKGIIAEAISTGREFTLYDEGRPRRDWTFVSDIVSGVLTAADVEMGYQVFNLGRSQPVLMRDFVTILEGLIGRPARWRNAPLPPTDLPVTFADTTKANQMLGYSPRISIQEGLSRFWNWYKANNFHSPPG